MLTLIDHKYGRSALYQVYDLVNMTMVMHIKELSTIVDLMYDCWCLNVSDLFGGRDFRDEV